MLQSKIKVRGARVHNLQNVDLDLPRNQLIVFTGLSGSGKSSLAFDTLYAEGQRRYVESLSAYARQFLEKLDKPDVDSIEGLSPAISIDQKSTSHNPRSTVGTVTEIYDYLRLLFASIGIPHCPSCGDAIQRQSCQEIVDQLIEKTDRTVLVLAPLISGKKGEHRQLLEMVQKEGFSRVKIDGTIHRVSDPIKLTKTKAHDIDIVIDRVTCSPANRTRLYDSVEIALKHGKGLIRAEQVDGDWTQLYSEHFSCPKCHVNLAELSTRLFSFNSPYGACTTCNGLGDIYDFDPDLVIEDENLPVRLATQKSLNLDDTIYGRRLAVEAENQGFSMDTLVKDLSAEQRNVFLFGTKEDVSPSYTRYRGRWKPRAPRHWEGVIGNLKRRYGQTQSEGMRLYFRAYMSAKTCQSCQGARLKPDALCVTVNQKSIAEIGQLTIEKAVPFFTTLKLNKKEKEITAQLLKEITSRLTFLQQVGLTYITLNRKANTLSGGELQRIRLATQIGSGLTGVMYVLDEPSIGLHQRDNQQLLDTLIRLRDLGNTVIVVEHDEDTIREADYLVDIGPEAGRHGGQIIYAGKVPGILKAKESITGQFLTGKQAIIPPKKRRSFKKQEYLILKGAEGNNLKKVTLKLPLGKLVAVTGVSGSGKSTLINQTLYPILARHYTKKKGPIAKYASIDGLDHIDKVIPIDQSPIGRTPRSNPATYTQLFTPIRELFAKTREARIRGYKAGRFSFNVKGGRCEACQGDGVVKIEMHFLPDVYVMCEVCKGKRYNDETLEVTFKGYSINDVLNLTVNQAVETFENIPQLYNRLKTLQAVGLGYITLGQNATTLSGGEAQRIKLSKELGKRSTGQTLYLLDEPTTGLHFADIKNLLGVLNRLVDAGNTVLVIEHNLDVIKCADHVIDLGPEGGEKGGKIIVEGPPETIAKHPKSHTGKYLKAHLK